MAQFLIPVYTLANQNNSTRIHFSRISSHPPTIEATRREDPGNWCDLRPRLGHVLLLLKELVTGGYHGSLTHEHTFFLSLFFSGHFPRTAHLVGSDSSNPLVGWR